MKVRRALQQWSQTIDGNKRLWNTLIFSKPNDAWRPSILFDMRSESRMVEFSVEAREMSSNDFECWSRIKDSKLLTSALEIEIGKGSRRQRCQNLFEV